MTGNDLIRRLILLQITITVIAAAVFYIGLANDTDQALSAALGGLCAVLPNLYMATRLISQTDKLIKKIQHYHSREFAKRDFETTEVGDAEFTNVDASIADQAEQNVSLINEEQQSLSHKKKITEIPFSSTLVKAEGVKLLLMGILFSSVFLGFKAVSLFPFFFTFIATYMMSLMLPLWIRPSTTEANAKQP